MELIYIYNNGKCHRNDKDKKGKILPAVYNNGDRIWYNNGKQHRDDRDENGRLLPAVIYRDRHREWWVNGQPVKMSRRN